MSNYVSNLTDILQMPSIIKNLISVSMLSRDNNFYYKFHYNKCFIKYQASNVVLLEGFLDENDLYCFTILGLEPSRNFLSHKSQSSCPTVNHTLDFHVHNKFQSINIVVSPNVWSIWHAKLGHSNPRALKSISQLCNIPISNKNVTNFWNSCCVGKSHKLFDPLPTTNYTQFFEQVHSDLWGPSPSPVNGGYNYYIVLWMHFLGTFGYIYSSIKMMKFVP